MADLGTIGRSITSFYRQPVPLYAVGADRPNGFGIAQTSTLSGTVTLSGTPQQNVKVRLYYRATGMLISQAITSSSGTFSFPNLDPTDQYYVVAVDPLETGPYNYTLVLDHLTPG